MKENLLHFIWKNKLYYTTKLETTQGDSLEIIHPGLSNNDSGPDFINAKIKINDTIWVGSVEIHLKSSNWFNHKHHVDENYNNVILHVVYNNDSEIHNTKNVTIPNFKITFPESIENHFNKLLNSKSNIACKDYFPSMDQLSKNMWIDRMAIERIQHKVSENNNILKENINDWNDTFYKLLFQSFGFKVNKDAFLQLAENIKPNIWIKHKANLLELESLLFGVAGFLEENNCNDKYYLDLQTSFKYLQVKYNLEVLNYNVWKYLRLRPNNFPTIRISQLAYLLHKTDLLDIILNKDIKTTEKYFSLEGSEYWNTHYIFGKESKKQSVKNFGKDSAYNVLINSVIPFLFSYGETLNKPKYTDKSFSILESIPAEENSITKEWHTLGLKPTSALHSQALIHIQNEYCNKKNCLHCVVGKDILSKV